jgi:hypothetical protein
MHNVRWGAPELDDDASDADFGRFYGFSEKAIAEFEKLMKERWAA